LKAVKENDRPSTYSLVCDTASDPLHIGTGRLEPKQPSSTAIMEATDRDTSRITSDRREVL
jgi:hypothetical protein